MENEVRNAKELGRNLILPGPHSWVWLPVGVATPGTKPDNEGAWGQQKRARLGYGGAEGNVVQHLLVRARQKWAAVIVNQTGDRIRKHEAQESPRTDLPSKVVG